MGVSSRVRPASHRVAALTLLLGGAAFAGAEPATDTLEACRSIADDARRLACYDDIPLPATVPQAPAVVDTVVTPAPRKTTPDPPPVPDPPSAPEDAPVADAASDDANVVQRGLGRLRGLFGRDEPAPEKPPELQSIEGQVVKIVKLARGNHSLTLEDGQMWRESEVKPRARYRVGDAVVIARGAFGSYNLSSERTGHRVKVRRIR